MLKNVIDELESKLNRERDENRRIEASYKDEIA